MSTIKVANISHPSATSPAIKLAADGTAGIAALNVNTQSGTTYTFTGDDAGRLVAASNASAKTFTIPPQSSVAWAAGTVLNVVNYGAGALTVNGGSGVTVTNTAKTLAQYESAAAIRTGSNAWTLVPFSGGAGNADFSNTATGTYSDGGVNYKYITFNGSGTLTVTQAGLADVLVVGGGGGGASQGFSSGGGAGGHLVANQQYFSVGSHAVIVGGGGAGVTGANGLSGNGSYVGVLTAAGGGGGNYNGGQNGGSGSGARNGSGGSGIANQGNAGAASANPGGGGGGAGAAGSGPNGGAGAASSITGSSVTRAGGGGGGGQGGNGTGGAGGGAAGGGSYGGGGIGTANTGGGGGGGGRVPSTGAAVVSGAGGSGVVIVRVQV